MTSRRQNLFNNMPGSPKQPKPCELCGRLTRRGTTEHHLIPRRCHRNKWFKKRFTRAQMQRTISLCHDCHQAIHRFVPREKDLGRYHNTVATLMEHEQIGRFVAWVRDRK
ncbi:hypothetical protein [Roseiconus nitratireducens]|uniref:hypothetical protein n=1 Tax=Roseiconus nitratireducens TaxID=2605748 RepID=UPI001F480AEA|nr:hypothetical protein [Roseiconus nitratireducens]